jgi:hypothetical protein
MYDCRFWPKEIQPTGSLYAFMQQFSKKFYLLLQACNSTQSSLLGKNFLQQGDNFKLAFLCYLSLLG